MIAFLVLTVWLLGCIHRYNAEHSNPEHLLRQSLRLRHQTIRRVAYTKRKPISCPTDRLLVITEYQFGRTGNNIIEFTHGLWVAEKMNASLVVPKYMQDILTPFDTSTLSQLFCYTLDTEIPKGVKVFEVTSEDSFFTYKLFRDPVYRDFLPAYNDDTVSELSMHYLQVYASLWCCPTRKLLLAAEHVIQNHLNGNLQYAAVHKRQLEGGCSKIMGYVTKPSDYSPHEIAMQIPDWNQNLVRNHPLCEMPLIFVAETMKLNHRNQSLLFVAFDGRGNIQDYLSFGAIFTNNVPESKQWSSQHLDPKFVDMLVSIHSDFFILNPRSTFSWQIYLIRLCLSLPSVPVIRTNDLYMQKVPEDLVIANRSMWVSMTSVVDVLLK